ncbi:WD40 repeat domain-containing protein [Pyxidicoccus sp. MSG2]|uniref:WD40 repeat domain-containing protein n=1 Tax=Pyxidicoccus sp. MSG2 TaxID=2996790 RepID=UPI002270FA2B|nr:WD40 repeat domain-containing protein [Pyxidicoccus sp. MSG2]MCY1017233.1 WD40 repeat domain-containing protein [Pyxidicoccus sp. MSG2]
MRPGRRAVALLAFGWLAAGAGCVHAPPTLAPDVEARLTATPGGYLSGSVVGWEVDAVLNRQDFIWGLAFSPRGGRVAYTRLGSKFYFLSLWSLGPPPKLLADPQINPYEFDVEGVAFSPDGALVATAGKDGVVRLFDAATGALRGERRTEEPLGAVAFHPDGKWLVVGSLKGLLTVLAVPGLEYASEERGHVGVVSALAFAPDGTLYSGGWDKHLRAWRTGVEALKPGVARVHFERRGGSAVLGATVNDKAPVSLSLDARAPALILTSAAATAAGIDVAFLKETLNLPGALGTTAARLARNQSLRFKSLLLEGMDVAVCDSCVPQGSQGVLGSTFTDRVDVAFDEVTQEAVLTLKGGAPVEPTRPVEALVLSTRSDFTFPAYVSDVTVDARGQRLGVGLSEQLPERNRTVYERERKHVEEPQGPFNTGALVDAQSGQVLHKWPLHRGVVSSAAISPDGRSLATGGWDKKVYLFTEGADAARAEHVFDWSVRRVRFSADGRQVGVAAWTPQVASSSGDSDPAAVLLGVRYAEPSIEGAAAPPQ